MKKMLLVFLATILLLTPVFAISGEKEELELKKSMLEERRDKLVVQNQLIQIQFAVTQKELAEVVDKLTSLAKKDAESKKAK